MSLPLGERRRLRRINRSLRRIERSLERSDSRLVPLFSIFNRLTWLEAMPASEQLSAQDVRRGERRGVSGLSVRDGHRAGPRLPRW
jgi:hypothetical protein